MKRLLDRSEKFTVVLGPVNHLNPTLAVFMPSKESALRFARGSARDQRRTAEVYNPFGNLVARVPSGGTIRKRRR